MPCKSSKGYGCRHFSHLFEKQCPRRRGASAHVAHRERAQPDDEGFGRVCAPSDWDFDRNGHKPVCPDRKYIRRIILKVGSEYYRTKLSGKAACNEDCTAETSPCPFGLTRKPYNPLFAGNRVAPTAISSFSSSRALRSASGLCCILPFAGISVRAEERTLPCQRPAIY